MKRTIGLVLFIIMMFSFSACNGTGNSKNSMDSSNSEVSLKESDNTSTANKGKIYDSTEAFSYMEVDGGLTITDFKNYDYIEYDKIIIPSMLDGKKVVGIGDSEKDYMVFTAVFGKCEIVVPDTVTFIGDNAFSGSDGLYKLSGGTNCKTIGQYAFMNCINLEEITFIDTVTDVAENAFVGCTKWKESDNTSTANDGKIYDSTEAFTYKDVNGGITITEFKNYDYIEYEKIIIPSEIDGRKVVGIGDLDQSSRVLGAVFGNCEVVIPDSVTYIGINAFSGAKGLVKLSGGKNCKTIGEYAFNHCKNLEEITFLSTVTDVSENAFAGCTKWEENH